jgi:ABC-type branched-subunit amino acid transport system ATPase component
MELMLLFNLEDQPYQLSSSLPYGDQRKLEIVRALALQPKLLLLDEPVAGMSLQESLDVLQLIRRIRDEYNNPQVIEAYLGKVEENAQA